MRDDGAVIRCVTEGEDRGPDPRFTPRTHIHGSSRNRGITGKIESERHGDNPDRKLWSVIDWMSSPRSPSDPRFQHLINTAGSPGSPPMSELNSQITRLKITYLDKLPLFISLKSLCRYSSKAVSLLMRRTQENNTQCGSY